MVVVIHRMIIQKTLRYSTATAEFLGIPGKIGTVAGFLKRHNTLKKNSA